MAESIGKPKLQRIVEHFQRFGVEFMIIGGAAAVLHGSPLPTFDVDLCYRRTQDNLEKLARALEELDPKLRGAPPDLPFVIDARSLALGSNFTFTTSVGPLDLLAWVEPFGIYEALLPHAEKMQLGDVEALVIGLDDLVTIKRHIKRPKDQAALAQLEEVQRLREKEGENHG